MTTARVAARTAALAFSGILAGVLAASSATALEPRLGAHLRTLDKITGNATDVTAKIGETIKFGRISVTVRACYQSPPEDTPESEAFLEIRSLGAAQDKPLRDMGPAKEKPAAIVAAAVDPNAPLFSGWMFASSPGLSALEHPVYDVWVISCTAAAPAPTAPAPDAAPDAAPAAPAAPATPPSQ